MIIENTGNFSVMKTFDCGQCFRFEPVGEDWSEVRGTVGDYPVRIKDLGGAVEIDGDGERGFWEKYLSLDTDYAAIDGRILSALDGENDRQVMSAAVGRGAGIRILRQDPWETLISFIISQNNNIPRIKKIISAMCESCGKALGGGEYAFPTPEALCSEGADGLLRFGCGFRAKYIYGAAKMVAEGEIDLAAVPEMKEYADADEYLRRIAGVGPKVSACTLLFGFGRLDAFPIDVWVKRIMEKRFPNGLDYTRFGEYAGIAQQYLFYYERWCAND